MPARVYDAGGVIYGQGGSSDHVFNLISGWIALHRDLADGRRQITRFLVAGAMFGVEPAGEELGHAATALTNATVCPIPTTKLDELRRQFPSLNERFILMLNRDNRRAYEALTTLGQGSAKERIAHLLGELAAAASDPNPIHAGRVIKIPLTQRHIAEADQAGAETVLLMCNRGAMPQELFLNQIRRLGAEVVPRLQAHKITRVPFAETAGG